MNDVRDSWPSLGSEPFHGDAALGQNDDDGTLQIWGRRQAKSLYTDFYLTSGKKARGLSPEIQSLHNYWQSVALIIVEI